MSGVSAGAISATSAGSLARKNQQQRAGELRQLLGQLGPSFVKVGQALSARPDLLPQVYLDVSPPAPSIPFSAAAL